MIRSKTRTQPSATPHLGRRGVLLGLTATELRRIASAFGLALPQIAKGQVPVHAELAAQCQMPPDGTAAWADQRRRRLQSSLESGFGVQYWGETFTATHLAAAPHGVFIIEPAKIGASAPGNSREVWFSTEEIGRIGQDGRRPVLGYLNLAKIEPYRDYWVDALAATDSRDTPVQGDLPWIGPSLGPDGTLARFWTPEWEAVLTDRVDRLLAQGVDGLFLDDVLQYFAYYAAVSEGRPGFAVQGSPVSAVDFANAMMTLVISIANRVRRHDCAALVVVNNGVFIGRDAGEDPPGSLRQDKFDQYRSAIDGVLIESVFASGGNAAAISVLQQEFASKGIPVLTIDFADATSNAPSADTRTTIAKQATREGFAAYIADDARFNRLYPPILAFQAAPAGP